MEDQGNKVMVATFANHYGAMLFRKTVGAGCTLRPVPRNLSSSCGTCAFFSGPFLKDYINENLEAVYEQKDGKYIKIYEN
jgi:hypothetical protein